MRTISIRSTAILLLAIAASCGGGGGGGSADSAPRLIDAAWSGNGPSPVAGDLLLLTFDQTVTLATGAVLTDADLALSVGSLGSGSVAPTLLNAHVVQVTLGAGTTFSPGTATIAFTEDNDVVFDPDGDAPLTDVVVTVQNGDGQAPVIAQLTLEGIEDLINGDGAPGGTLQVRRRALSIDVELASAEPVGRYALTIDAPVTVDGVVRAPGSDLAPALTPTSTTGALRLTLPAGVELPTGAMTLTAVVTDATGMPATPVAFQIRTVDDDASRRPLERGQLWFLDLSRDVESFEVQSAPGGINTRLRIVAGANGVPDLEDAFAVIGLRSATPIAAVENGLDSNQVVLARFRTALLEELTRFFDGTSVEFTFDRPGTFPEGRTSVPYADLGFSQICIAGAPVAGPLGTGTLGAAILDLRNATQDDDCQLEFPASSGPQRLGVFAHTFIDVGLQSPGSSEFGLTYRELAPALNGTPIGDDEDDDDRLTGALGDPRAAAIDTAIRNTARLLGLVTAHECGHSMGLVANGPMPAGLFGNDPFNFPPGGGLPDAAASNHINTSSLMAPGAQNVMSAAVDFDLAISPLSMFNTLNLAYLRERVLYDER